MNSNPARFIAALIIGLTVALFLRGSTACSGGEPERTASSAVERTQEQAVEQQPVGEVAADTDTPEGIIELRNATCPVMGGAARSDVFVDWEGYRINFCCAGCDVQFLSDPQRYLEILEEDPEVAERLREGEQVPDE